MKSATTTVAFKKTAACPASSTLLSFRSNSLSATVATDVKEHLELCDFCSAELPLLAHHLPLAKDGHKPPEIPMNLRVLAESILGHKEAQKTQKS
jgi:hypothetical protein